MTQITAKSKVANGGRIVIPAKFREALGINIGNSVTLTLEHGSVRITTRDDAYRRIDELMLGKRRKSRSVVDELIKERRAETKRG